MQRWHIAPADADSIIDSLRADGFIDDLRYACAYAQDKLHYNGWGRAKIRYMLRALRLSDAVVEQALEQIDEAEYEAIRQSLIAKKQREIKDTDPYQRKAKLQRFLYSRGFAVDDI